MSGVRGWGTPVNRSGSSSDVFVPNGVSRKETAILLVGTADEHGIDQRSILTASGGFYITEELASLLYDEPEPAKKTSGNRAAKKNSKEE